MNQNKIVSIIIGVALVAVGGSFYAGVKYNQSKNPAATRGASGAGGSFNFSQGGGTGGQRGMRGTGGENGGIIAGEIISKDDKSVTIKLRDGGSKIIFLSSSTSVMKTVGGATSDIVVGGQITATGNANSDGSITAQSIQIRPTQIR